MAEVFKGKSISMEGFERLVAIKRVLPNLVENRKFLGMFLDEAKLSLTLNHANVVQVFDLGRSGETYFIVMEFIEGTNLKKIMETLMRRNERMAIASAVYVLIEICKGLAHAHQKRDLQGRYMGIVHRDVSPPNILVSSEGEVKLTDFGLAKARSQVEVTDPGVVKGKFAYLSPEAAYGEEVDALTDIFACGIVLWEMLAGRRLFLGETDLQTLELVRKAQMPSLMDINPEVPVDLDQICRRALAPDKADRYSNAQELGRDLSEFIFSRSMRVTAYDISLLVGKVMRLTEKRKPKSSKRIMDLVQNEVENIIRIEQEANALEEADMVDALFGGDSASAGESSPVATVMEDPRTWGALFGEDGGLGDMLGADQEAPTVRTPALVDRDENGLPPETSSVTEAKVMRAGEVFQAPAEAGRTNPGTPPPRIPPPPRAEPKRAESSPDGGVESVASAEDADSEGRRGLRPVVFGGLALIGLLTAALIYLLSR